MFEKLLQCVLYAVHITLCKIHVCKKILFQSNVINVVFVLYSQLKKGSHGPLVIIKIRQ